jgi:hypothetical protein
MTSLLERVEQQMYDDTMDGNKVKNKRPTAVVMIGSSSKALVMRQR